MKDLFDKFMKRERVALSRLITHIENEDPAVVPIMKMMWKLTGKAYRIGITGPPGAGKSTLVNVLSQVLCDKGLTVGIVAVDPTSPFTGGALLGDRIRMTGALSSKEIFMRSMASRGGTGGLARTTPLVADLLDAFGFDIVIIETVGVGQLELDVAGTVDTTVVVLVPETSGNVQAMKAGLIEIADIFTINKSDREGSEHLRQELQEAMNLMPEKGGDWKIPIVKTAAIDGKGVEDLSAAIFNHKTFLEENDLLVKNRILQKEKKIVSIVKSRVESRLWNNEKLRPYLNTLSELCVEGKIDPFAAADEFLKKATPF